MDGDNDSLTGNQLAALAELREELGATRDEVTSQAEKTLHQAVNDFKLAKGAEHRFIFYYGGVQYVYLSLDEAKTVVSKLIKVAMFDKYQHRLETQQFISDSKLTYQNYQQYKIKFSLEKSKMALERMIEENQKNQKEGDILNYLDAIYQSRLKQINGKLSQFNLRDIEKFQKLNKLISIDNNSYSLNGCIPIHSAVVSPQSLPAPVSRKFPSLPKRDEMTVLFHGALPVYEVNADDETVNILTESTIKNSVHLCKTHTITSVLQVKYQCAMQGFMQEWGYFIGDMLSLPAPHVSTELNINYAYQLIDDIRDLISELERRKNSASSIQDRKILQEKKSALQVLVEKLDNRLADNKIYPNTQDKAEVSEIIDEITSWKKNKSSGVLGKHLNPVLRFLSENYIIHFKTKTELFVETLIENEEKLLTLK